MSEFINKINKIQVESSLIIENINMTTLLFSDSLICSKGDYTIADNLLMVKNQPQTTLDLFQFTDSSNYYEFLINLNNPNTVISGKDRYNNTLSNLSDTVLVFINGYKLSQSEYIIDKENNTITIKNIHSQSLMSNVVVYTSSDMFYEGNVEDEFSWNPILKEFILKDYTTERYIFFKNGELLPPTNIQKIGSYVRLNTIIRQGVDVIEYYRMSRDCLTLIFTPNIGYLTYGPKDDRGFVIENPYDCMITFDKVAKLAIDDVRPGFFLHENDTDGCIMIVDEDFEKRSLKCLTIQKFVKTYLTSTEYFITVPDAPSIMKYVSQYDLNGTLFKELLMSFQKVLLNETYDSIQRLRNIRNINKVDSSNISSLINFLGLKINVTNLTLEKKHQLVEELRTFYNTVGTRASYNFYNAIRNEGKILNIQQLFTPIKDLKSTDQYGPAQRYVDFRTPEEIGANYKERYETDVMDFGQVSELADGAVNLANSPNFEGVLRYQNYPVINDGYIDRYHPTESGPALSRDEITFSFILKTKTETTITTGNPDYRYTISGSTAVLDEYVGQSSEVVVPAVISNGETKAAIISITPNNLLVTLYDSDNHRIFPSSTETSDNETVFEFPLDNNVTYTYKVLDEENNILYSNTLQEGEKTISVVLPLKNDYVTSPVMGPNEPSVDCGYITDDPVDFYDFGSVAEQISGHWVTWYEWDRNKNWYPTNHVEIYAQIPIELDYDTFMNIFKDTFYEMASTVVYIHQITQMYVFGNPNNNGSEPVQPMSLLTTQTYQVEEQYFSNDPDFLPYRKAISNTPLELKSYMFTNPTFSYKNNNELEVSVDFYQNYGRDEKLYRETGEEKDIEIVERVTGVFPCEELNHTDWVSTQKNVNETPIITNLSCGITDNVPTITVTCTPNNDRTDWFYAVVINYDNKEEGYIVSKDLSNVTKVIDSSTIRKLQIVKDNRFEYVRPNSVFCEKGVWTLGYATVNEEFSRFEWKLATMNNDNPQNEEETLETGLGWYTFAEAQAVGWNNGNYNEVIVDSKLEIENSVQPTRGLRSMLNQNNKIYISLNDGKNVYSRIEYGFNLNDEDYTKHYSYTKDNAIWSCDLAKYTINDTVEVYNGSTEIDNLTVLLPTNMTYVNNNNGVRYNFTDMRYNFTSSKAEFKKDTSQQTTNRWYYTNTLTSTHNGTTLSFNTYGTVSKQIIVKDVDYLIFGYTHIPGHGSHLDTFTRIVNSKNSNYNIAVGHYTGDYAQIPYVSTKIGSWTSEMAYNPDALVQWCRHNQGTHEGSPYYYTTENVIINVNSFKDDLYKNDFDDVIIFDLYCAFLGSVSGVQSSQDVSITIRGYKNGNIVKYHHDEYPRHDIYKFFNLDDQGNECEPKFYAEEELDNMYILQKLSTTTSYRDIPENSSNSNIRERLRKVARISYTQSTKSVAIDIIPNQDEQNS